MTSLNLFEPKNSSCLSFLRADINFSSASTTVCIQNDSKRYKVHELLLVSYSGYLRKMLHKIKRGRKIVLSKNICDRKTLRLILDWMYTDEASDYHLLKPRCVPKVYESALRLDIPALASQCERVIQERLSVPAMIASLQKENRKEVYVTLTFKLLNNMKVLFKRNILKVLPFCVFTAILSQDELIPRQYQTVCSSSCPTIETKIFEAVVYWLKLDWKNRKIFAHSLLANIRFSRMSLKELQGILKNRQYMKILESCQRIQSDIDRKIEALNTRRHIKENNVLNAWVDADAIPSLAIENPRIPLDLVSVIKVTNQIERIIANL